MPEGMKDCIFYGKEVYKDSCRALSQPFCAKGGKCAFYKSDKRYMADGREIREAGILKKQFDNRVLSLTQDIGSIVRDNKTLDERYINLIRAKALAILTKCDDYLLKDTR